MKGGKMENGIEIIKHTYNDLKKKTQKSTYLL